MNRRILLIIAYCLGVIVLGLLLYVVFFRPISPSPNGNANGNENVNGEFPNLNGGVNRPLNSNGGLPNVNDANANRPTANTNTGPSSIANGGDTTVRTLVSQNAFASVVDSSGNVLYYDPSTGQFYKLDASGNVVPMGTTRFPSAEAVVWSPNRTSAILSFPDDSKVFYDFTTKKQATLPKEAEDFSFAPTGEQIAFKYNAANINDRYLVVANPDGTGMTPIEPLGDIGSTVTVSWSPNNQIVASKTKGVNGEAQEVVFAGLHGENFKTVVTDGRGFESTWAPSGQQLVYSTYSAASNFNPVLHIVDSQGDRIGGNNRSLDIQTWSDKCTFGTGGTSLFCAVPNSLASGSGIYRSQASQSADTFYKIDLTTGVKTQLAVPVGTDGSRQFSATNLGLSPDGRTLYFTDAPTGRVLQLTVR
ncbi:MAG: hypothetical protein WCV85_05650 [Patescibacteria group bacterium]|jgi:hypothetical protein